MLSIIKYSLKGIFRKRTRAVLTIAGIAIGVMSVITIASISDMGKSMVNSELESIGAGGLTVSAKAGSTYESLMDSDLEAIKKLRGVKTATPLISRYAKAKSCGAELDCTAWGVSSNVRSIVAVKLIHGRMINNGDIKSNAKVCVVDEEYAKANYLRTNIVGKYVSIMLNGGYEDYLVVGVVSAGGSILKNFIGDVVKTFIYLPYTTLQSQTGTSGFGRIAVKLEKDANSAEVSGRISETVGQNYPDSTKITVDDLSAQKDKLNSIMDTVTIVLAVIAGISIVVSGLSIMTIMLVSVSERKREIGIKKAIGASKFIILIEFLYESFILSITGGLVGSVLAFGIVALGCAFTGTGFIINFKIAGYAILSAIVTGMLFGAYPAAKAAKLSPALAIRYE